MTDERWNQMTHDTRPMPAPDSVDSRIALLQESAATLDIALSYIVAKYIAVTVWIPDRAHLEEALLHVATEALDTRQEITLSFAKHVLESGRVQ